MAKKKEITEETTDEQKEAEAAEQARAEEARKLADEQKAILEEQRKLVALANERSAKAEGMVEAMRNLQQSQGNKEWTTEQWDEFKEKTGISKEAITAIDNAFGAKLNAVESKYEERARQAEERAKQVEKKYEEFEKNRSFESQKRDYLAKRPQFARYEKEFDEFVNEFPIEVRKDPARLESIFSKAEVYVKGKVGEKAMRTPSGGSTRFGSDQQDDDSGEFKADLTDLRAHERLTVERIIPSRESLDKLKANKHDMAGDGGVMINSRDEFEMYKKK